MFEIKICWEKYFVFVITSFLCISCSLPPTLNLKEREFNKIPRKIVWFQIAGFSEDHLSLLKYAGSRVGLKLNLENNHCLGKMWRYNLFKLRPNAFESFMSQMTGRKNFKSNCEDFEIKPFWRYFKKERKRVGIFERGPVNFSFQNAFSCRKGEKNFYKEGVHYWFSKKRRKEKSSKMFHYLENSSIKDEGIYYDRSCHKGYCENNLVGNIKSLYERWTENKDSFVFIIRDFKYLSELRKKNILGVKEILFEIEEIYAYFLNKMGEEKNLLVLLTGASPLRFEFPSTGKEWFNYEKKGKNILYKRTSLMAPIFATGASAENFCGLYHETEVFKRLMWTQNRKKFIE